MAFFRQCEANTRLTANNAAIIKVGLFLLRVFDFDSIPNLEPNFYKSYLEVVIDIQLCTLHKSLLAPVSCCWGLVVGFSDSPVPKTTNKAAKYKYCAMLQERNFDQHFILYFTYEWYKLVS